MLKELRNIRTKQLFNLDAESFKEYHSILKHLKPKPTLNGKQAEALESLSFGEVVEIRHSLSKPNTDSISRIFNLVFGTKGTELYKSKILSFYPALNWIKKQMIAISKRESLKLTSTPDAKLKEAGIDNLNKFGELNTLTMLGEKYGTTPQEVEKWKYSLVFALVYQEKVTNDINKNYARIISRK